MAPALLGDHTRVRCPHCSGIYAVEPLDPLAADWRSTCPACGSEHDAIIVSDEPGYRVSVVPSGRAGEFRRWQIVAVRQESDDRMYVKRLVGMPDELVRISKGEIWVDQQIVQKSPHQFLEMAIPVTDSTTAREPTLMPAWRGERATSWRVSGERFVPSPGVKGEDRFENRIDWLQFQGRQLVGHKGSSALVWDDLSYNRTLSRQLNPVDDVVLDVSFRCPRDRLLIRARWGFGTWQLSCPPDGRLELAELGEGRIWRSPPSPFGHGPVGPDGVATNGTVIIQFGHLDGRILVARNWQPVIWVPTAGDDRDRSIRGRHASGLRELAIAMLPVESVPSLAGGEVLQPASIERLRVLRDVYYLELEDNRLESGRRLADRQYFVLGDNSAVSEDSRHWGPVDSRNLIGWVHPSLNRISSPP